MTDETLVESTDPEDAFGALADETRIDILRELWDADEDAVSFSTLRKRVGLRDSGQFNYHLEKLTDRFVRKTEDGYELTLAGDQVNGAIRAGAYTMDGTVDPVDLDDPCPYCGGSRKFRYEDETAVIECDDCDVKSSAGVPPGVFDAYDREAFPSVASRYFRTILQQVGNGFCWHCDGRVRPTVLPLEETVDDEERAEVPDEYRGLPFVRYDCQRCGADIMADLGMAFLDHPPVVSFHHDHGIDVTDRPYWEFSTTNTDEAVVRQRNPLRASVTYEAGGETLTLVVDEDLEILEREQSDR